MLKQCGDDLTRENVMKQAASLHNLKLPMLLPGIVINTSATNFAADQASPDAAFRRRALRSIRPGPERRDRLTRAGRIAKNGDAFGTPPPL